MLGAIQEQRRDAPQCLGAARGGAVLHDIFKLRDERLGGSGSGGEHWKNLQEPAAGEDKTTASSQFKACF